MPEERRKLGSSARGEEIEHAIMSLERLRRTNANFAEHMKTNLITEGDILEIEEEAK